MDQRRAFALIFSSVICAFVLTFSVVTPGFGPAPQHSAAVTPSPDTDELMMTSLHLEARNALALLQASASSQ